MQCFGNVGAFVALLAHVLADNLKNELVPPSPDYAEVSPDESPVSRVLRDATQKGPTPLASAVAALRRAQEMALQWHFAMLNDEQRTEAFRHAITLAVQPGDLVLDVGAGTGLLALMAVDAGASKVVAVEENEFLAEIAQETVLRNGYEDRVVILNLRSDELDLTQHLQDRRADVLLCELVGFSALTEHILPFLEDVRQRLLKSGGSIVPAVAQIWAVPIECEELASTVAAPVVSDIGYDLSSINALRDGQLERGMHQIRYFGVHLSEANTQILTKAALLADIDFSLASSYDLGGRTNMQVGLIVQKQGIIHAVVEYFVVFLDASRSISISTHPTLGFGAQSGASANARNLAWSHHVHLLRGGTGRGLRVEQGDAITLKWNIAGKGSTGRPAWLPIFELYREARVSELNISVRPPRISLSLSSKCDFSDEDQAPWVESHQNVVLSTLLRCSRKRINFRFELGIRAWRGNVTLMAPSSETARNLCNRAKGDMPRCLESAIRLIESAQLNFYDDLVLSFPHGAIPHDISAGGETRLINSSPRDLQSLPRWLWFLFRRSELLNKLAPTVCIVGSSVQWLVIGWLRAMTKRSIGERTVRILVSDTKNTFHYLVLYLFLQHAFGSQRITWMRTSLPEMKVCDLVHVHIETGRPSDWTSKVHQANTLLADMQKHVNDEQQNDPLANTRCPLLVSGDGARFAWGALSTIGLVEKIDHAYPGIHLNSTHVSTVVDMGRFRRWETR